MTGGQCSFTSSDLIIFQEPQLGMFCYPHTSITMNTHHLVWILYTTFEKHVVFICRTQLEQVKHKNTLTTVTYPLCG